MRANRGLCCTVRRILHAVDHVGFERLAFFNEFLDALGARVFFTRVPADRRTARPASLPIPRFGGRGALLNVLDPNEDRSLPDEISRGALYARVSFC